MSKRCYCVLSATEYSKPNYREIALAQLASGQVESFGVEEAQLYAWEQEIEILKEVVLSHPDSVLALEYMIPRMGKRIDAVLLLNGIVFALEFKVGERRYATDSINQVADYAFDLRNFHLESHDKPIVPISVCTEAPEVPIDLEERFDGIFEVLRVNRSSLSKAIELALDRIETLSFDYENWLNSAYSPTPTIVEAAQALYESNEVEDITRHEADITDINATTDCVNEIIEHSKRNRRKSICFITGVPGAGKTLVGLNIASKRRKNSVGDMEEIAVFLSGNGPLIEVLQESLTRDQKERDEEACALCNTTRSRASCSGSCQHYRTKTEIKSEVTAFIQGVHLFREELFKSELPPAEHIAIFDESQRAWSREWLSYKMRTRRQNQIVMDKSEPECLIEYMNRLDDWATMVCLVGGGQEINSGEAGIGEWFEALNRRFPDWDIFASPALASPHYLDPSIVDSMEDRITQIDELHLGVDMRSFRNKNVAALAEAIVENDPCTAKELYKNIFENYPIYVTRDLNKAKNWARSVTVRPSDRYGIIADSHGERIRADGVIVPSDTFNAATWFLEGKDNINSSYFMEVAASEFKIQGLEIDYAVVAWEADYRYSNGKFSYHRFTGGKWQNVNAEQRRRYLANGYRVLLTRARQGYVIYVPTGSEYDPTRPSEWYDGTFEYLKSIGIKEL